MSWLIKMAWHGNTPGHKDAQKGISKDKRIEDLITEKKVKSGGFRLTDKPVSIVLEEKK